MFHLLHNKQLHPTVFVFFPNLLGTAKSITCGSFIWPSAQSASPWIPADRSSLPLPPGVLVLGPWTRTSRQSTAPIKKTGYHLLAIKPTRCVKSSRAENRSLFRVWLVRGLSRWIPHIAVTENHCCLTKSQSTRVKTEWNKIFDIWRITRNTISTGINLRDGSIEPSHLHLWVHRIILWKKRNCIIVN